MRTMLATLVGTIFTLSAAASFSETALRYTLVTDIVREEEGDVEVEKFVDRVLVDGSNARIEVTRIDDGTPGEAEIIITNDGGRNLAISDGRKAVCGQWSVEEFGLKLGQLLNRGYRLINGDVTELSVGKVEEKPGPSLHGHPTTYLKLESSLAVEGKILFKRLDYRVDITDDVWMTDALPLPQHEAQWLWATAHTGFEDLDALNQQWDAEVTGTVLKGKNVVRMTNQRSGDISVRTETIEVTELENLDSASVDPASFVIPECEAVGRVELKSAALRYLRKSVK